MPLICYITLESGEIQTISEANFQHESLRKWLDDKIAKKYDWRTVFVEDDKQQLQKLAKARNYLSADCVFWDVIVGSEPGYQKVKRFLDSSNHYKSEENRLVTFEVDARAYIYSLKRGEMQEQKIKAYGIVSELTGNNCDEA